MVTTALTSPKKTCKVFVLAFLAVLASFAALNYLVWICFTKELLKPESQASDLVRLCYLVKISQKKETGIDLPKRHVGIGAFTGGQVDMVTVGDSFSLGGGGGKNNYYQDYIASLNDFVVVNVPSRLDKSRVGLLSPVNTLAILYNSGMLDMLKPRYVLLESVERYIPERFLEHFTFDESENLDRLIQHYRKYQVENIAGNEGVTFINTGNAKFVYFNIKDLFDVERINKKVYKTRLKTPLFSGKYGDRLYVYHEEYDNQRKLTRDGIRKINDNLNYIADKLASKNISLVFMPIVDRSDLYDGFAVRPRKFSIFFEEIRKLPKRYQFIDTKAILLPELQRGEKDLYFMDDTHWNPKAAKKIFETVRFEKKTAGLAK